MKRRADLQPTAYSSLRLRKHGPREYQQEVAVLSPARRSMTEDFRMPLEIYLEYELRTELRHPRTNEAYVVGAMVEEQDRRPYYFVPRQNKELGSSTGTASNLLFAGI